MLKKSLNQSHANPHAKRPNEYHIDLGNSRIVTYFLIVQEIA